MIPATTPFTSKRAVGQVWCGEVRCVLLVSCGLRRQTCLVASWCCGQTARVVGRDVSVYVYVRTYVVCTEHSTRHGSGVTCTMDFFHCVPFFCRFYVVVTPSLLVTDPYNTACLQHARSTEQYEVYYDQTQSDCLRINTCPLILLN